ncbi:MAG: aspartate/glutamate racemase family protein [Eubacteriales bacterium]|nr:aspartate/glutamate racemase family protein [Eubacteriales bacterium]
MKTVGLIGGMSWESTIPYYQILNEAVKKQLGGLHSAKILLYSVDFYEIEACMSRGDWDAAARLLGDVAERLEHAGADLILICTNTLHKVAPQVQQRIHVPLVHIAEAAADALLEKNIRKVALLGTKYTMTQEFYRDVLQKRGIEVLIPEGEDIDLVNRVIFEELCLGIVNDSSKREYLRIIRTMEKRGASALLLGCTELGLILSQNDVTLPLFDTTVIHAKKASDLSLGK